MSLFSLPATFRSVNRLRVIVGVLSRHGFGGLIDDLNLGRLLPVRRRLAARRGERLSGDELWGERLTAALRELGPMFIKLGQVLSSRPDVLPLAVTRQLASLQDRVPASDVTEVRAALESELGGPVEGYFSSFDWEPIGGGSMAQVHRAVAIDGQPVVVKVRRPGIERMIQADGELLASLASLLESRVPESRVYRPVVLVDEFVRSVAEELDFVSEAANTGRFAAAFADSPTIVIPAVRWDLTRSGVLTLSRLAGKSLSRPETIQEFAVDRKVMAEALLDAFIEQYFRMGLFHADPHPGNLMVMGSTRVGILDFGLVGHLSDDMRDRLVTALVAALERELDVVVRIFAEIGSLSDETNTEDLKSDLQKLINKYFALSLGRFALDRLFADITKLTRRHRVALPRDFVMIIKSLITIGGVGMTLDPNLDLAGLLKPRLRAVLWSKLSPGSLLRRLVWGTYNVQHFLWEFPLQTGELLRRANRGQLTITARLPAVEHLAGEIDRTGNRMTLGVIIAAGLVASAIMLAHRVPPLVPLILTDQDDISLFGLMGLLVCAAGGLMLLRAMYQSGRLS